VQTYHQRRDGEQGIPLLLDLYFIFYIETLLFERSLLLVLAYTFSDNALGFSILSILIEGVWQSFCWSGATPTS
jgi:hypothetical protein